METGAAYKVFFRKLIGIGVPYKVGEKTRIGVVWNDGSTGHYIREDFSKIQKLKIKII